MKQLVSLIAICLFMMSCGMFKKQHTEMEDENEVVEVDSKSEQQNSKEQSFRNLGVTFTNALKTGDKQAIKAFYPDIKVTRFLVKEEAAEKSDEDIQKSMLKPLMIRFEKNIDIIRTEMQENEVNSSLFNFIEYELMDDGIQMPSVLSLIYDNNGERVSIPVTTVYYDNKLYVFEILNTRGLFD